VKKKNANAPLRTTAQKAWIGIALLALLCSLAALVGGTTILVRQAETTLEEVEQQSDLTARLREMQALLVNVVDAETGQRGYLLTGKRQYLEPYHRAVAALPDLLKKLRNVKLREDALHSKVDKAQYLVEMKMEELAETIRLHDEGQHAAALALVDSDAGRNYMVQARTEVNAVLDIVRNERDRLNQRIAEGARRGEQLLAITAGLFLLFIVLTSVQVGLTLRARAKSERALAQSEQRHRAIVEEQDELVSLSRADGTLVYVNPAYARYFGLDVNQMVGTSLYDFIEPADRAAAREELAKVFKTGEMGHSENRMTASGGGERWVAWTNRRQLDGDGNQLLHSVGRDFTERKALLQRLAESERFVNRITDQLPVRIAYLDREVRYRFVNLAHCERFNRSKSEILGRTRAELVGDGLSERTQAVLAGYPQRFEFEEMVNGKLRRIESQLIPDMKDDGEVVGFYSTGIDITERTAAERALRELNEIIEHSSDFVIQTDARGTIQYLNPAVRRALGLKPDEPMVGRSFQEFNTPETNQKFVTEVVPAVHAGGVWSGEATVYAEGGRVVPVSHMVIAHRDRDGRVARYSGVMRDISAEVLARQKLQLQTATLQSVTEAIPAMVAVVGADGRYRFVNRALERWLGTRREEMVGRTMEEVLGPAEYERTKPWIDKVLIGETVNFEKDFPERQPPMHLAVSYIPLRVDDGRVDGFVSVSQDITQHRQEAVRLLQLSERDSLTGLSNRAGFEKYLDAAVAEGDAASLALLYIDLDHFKPVNDQHGHPVGDELLRLFARRLQGLVRPTDAVARLGGDEFAIVLSGMRERAKVEAIADKIVEAAHAPFKVGELQLRIGASIGLAYDASEAGGLEAFIARADSMLYRAKAQGRGRRA
jgi:diguanylate cyclase (GGDEF)-like protein/PAS domain S-box-containing protein